MTFTDADGAMLTTDFKEPIPANASVNSFRSALKGVYNEKVGSTITVTRVMFDTNGDETDVEDEAVDFEYTISLDKRITGQTFTAIQAQGTTSDSPTFLIQTPDLVQLSSAPLEGKFTVACTIDGGLYTTDAMDYDIWSGSIAVLMYNAMPNMRDSVKVRNTYKYPYKVNGLQYMLEFNGLEENIPQCIIQSDTETPLTGADPLGFEGTTQRDFGQNMFYEPIPL